MTDIKKPILIDLPMPIETPRLILRLPRPEDAMAVTEAKQRVWHDLQLWMSWAYNGEETLEATERFIAALPQQIEAGGYTAFGFCKLTGAFVVATDLSPEHTTGYWVAQDFLGKGYATEACNAVIRHAFNALNLDAVYIDYYEGNAKSARVIEKLGFSPLRISPKAKSRCLDGTLLDIHHFVMTDPTVLPPLDVKWGP